MFILRSGWPPGQFRDAFHRLCRRPVCVSQQRRAAGTRAVVSMILAYVQQELQCQYRQQGRAMGEEKSWGRFMKSSTFPARDNVIRPGAPPWPDRLGVGAGPRGAAEWADLICRVDLGIAGVPGG